MDNITELEKAQKMFGENFTSKDLKKYKRKSLRNLKISVKESKHQQKINEILDKINDKVKLTEEHKLAKNIIHRCLKELNMLHANHEYMQRVIICIINGKGVIDFVNDYWNFYVHQFNSKIDKLNWFIKKRYRLNNFKINESSNKLEDILHIKVIENDKVFPKEIKIEFIGLETQFQINENKHINNIETISIQIVDKTIKQLKKSFKLNNKKFEILN